MNKEELEKQIKAEERKALAYKLGSYTKAAAKIGLMVLTDGEYKPNSGRAVMSHRMAMDKSYEHYKKARELEAELEKTRALEAKSEKTRKWKTKSESEVFEIGDGVLISYKGNADNVIIPNSIIVIGYGAFWGCRSLKSITIPDSVKSIGDYAFFSCEMLSVKIPPSVSCIGEKALGYLKENDELYYYTDFTIYGKSGSAAEKYAKKNGFKFVAKYK